MRDCLIGIDLGGTFIKGGVIGTEGAVLRRLKRPTGAQADPGEVLRNVLRVIARLQGECGGEAVRGIGIGVPGVLDRARTEVVESPNLLAWRHFPLRGELAGRLSVPFFLENDANAAALGEGWLGAARGLDSFLLITLGTGVGGGLVLSGNLWRGDSGRAGEIGHLTVEPGGFPCPCGSRGCLEVYAAAGAITRLTREVLRSGEETRLRDVVGDPEGPVRAEIVEAAARAGDRAALEIYRAVGRYLGIGIAGVVNLLDVRDFFIGGGIGNAFDLLAGSLREEVRGRVYGLPAGGVRVEKTRLGEDAGILGAARLALRGLNSPGAAGEEE